MRTETDPSKVAPGSVLVLTMGGLHDGHRALIQLASALAKMHRAECVASVFVNPTQFNDPSDLAAYPRTPEADIALAESARADVLFTPAPDAIYPPGVSIPQPDLPPLATEPRLEDAARPGHFAGVAQVVLRFFDLLEPAVALFGEKDWQQLRLIQELVKSHALPIRIEPHPTVRDADGLAMSSRNKHLSAEQRTKAAAVPRAIQAARAEPNPDAAEAAARDILLAAGLTIDYAAVRDAQTLMRPIEGTGRVLIAARAGDTRLLDNAAWPAVGD
ncbi:MAG: pantoate--beta-alanine ligase [Planctomycetota bacterium]